MPPSPDTKAEPGFPEPRKSGGKLGTVTGVYIPVCLNIMSILMFLRFGHILGRVGFVGIIGEYCTISPVGFTLTASQAFLLWRTASTS